MALGQYFKTPDERKRYSLDYVDWLDDDEEVSSVEFVIAPSGALEVDAHSISADGKEVVFFLNAGDDGIEYTVNVKATTSGGQLKEDEVFVTVQAL